MDTYFGNYTLSSSVLNIDQTPPCPRTVVIVMFDIYGNFMYDILRYYIEKSPIVLKYPIYHV